MDGDRRQDAGTPPVTQETGYQDEYTELKGEHQSCSNRNRPWSGELCTYPSSPGSPTTRVVPSGASYAESHSSIESNSTAAVTVIAAPEQPNAEPEPNAEHEPPVEQEPLVEQVPLPVEQEPAEEQEPPEEPTEPVAAPQPSYDAKAFEANASKDPRRPYLTPQQINDNTHVLKCPAIIGDILERTFNNGCLTVQEFLGKIDFTMGEIHACKNLSITQLLKEHRHFRNYTIGELLKVLHTLQAANAVNEIKHAIETHNNKYKDL